MIRFFQQTRLRLEDSAGLIVGEVYEPTEWVQVWIFPAKNNTVDLRFADGFRARDIPRDSFEVA